MYKFLKISISFEFILNYYEIIYFTKDFSKL